MDFYENTEKMLIKIEKQVGVIVSKMKTNNHQNPEDVFFDSQEFMKLMNISKRTAQQWRDKKVIGYSQVGNKIYYTLSDILELLKENYNHKQEKKS